MAPKKKQKTEAVVDVRFDPEAVNKYVEIARQSHVDAPRLLDHIVESVNAYGDAFKWLEARTGDAAVYSNLATRLHARFPPLGHTAYLDAVPWPTGLTAAQLWMVSFDDSAGFSSFTDADLLGMIGLQMSKTCLADPSQQGIEALSMRVVTPKFAIKLVNGAGDILNHNIMPGSVGFVKGRKRTCAALALALACLDLDYDMLAKWPALWTSLCALHCTFQECGDERDQFLASMSISINNSMTRVRPPVTAWVRNMKFRFKMSNDVVEQTLDKYDANNKGSLISMLSKKERVAATTMVSKMPDSTVTTILDYCQRFGLGKRSAIGLDCLQSQLLRVGAQPVSGSVKWKDILTSTDTSVDFAVDRMLKDPQYTNMPPKRFYTTYPHNFLYS